MAVCRGVNQRSGVLTAMVCAQVIGNDAAITLGGTPAHVVLLKTTNSLRKGFDFSQCFHRDTHQHPP